MIEKTTNMYSFLTIVIITGHLTTTVFGVSIPKPESEYFPGQDQPKIRVARQFYVCPPDFKRISNYCYYFSHHMATWQDAHYDCRDRDSELAILQKPAEDRKLRGQLNKLEKPLEWWIGGIYDWEQMQWKWVSGKQLEYHGFSRMGPENKEKLKWHCTIMDPGMKYKWGARSCVHGKYYICQKEVERVDKRGLRKLRKKYNNTLNEIPAPIYQKPQKPRKHENQLNGNRRTNLKHHRPNGVNVNRDFNRLNNAFGHRRNSTELRKGRKGKKNRKGRKNRNKKLSGLHIWSGNNTEIGDETDIGNQKTGKRNRRNKSKESSENLIFSQEDLTKSKKKLWSNENYLETRLLTNTLSPLHPKVIVEEHDFLDWRPNKITNDTKA